MKMRYWGLLFLCLSFYGLGNAHGQVFGASARTEFFGGFGIRVFYSGISKTKLLLNGNRITNTDDSEVSVNLVPVTIVYGVSPRLSVISVLLPLRRTFKGRVNGQRVSNTISGIGDVMFLGKYRFYKKDGFLKSRQMAIHVGMKLPSGNDDLKDGEGNRFPSPLQLGSGSVDYRFILSLTEVRNRWTFTGDVGYTLKTEANNFEFGDVIDYDFAAKVRIYPAKYTDRFPARDLYGVLEVNGIMGQKSKQNNIQINDSGGHQIFLAPGLQFLPVADVLLEVGIQIPISEKLHGTQLGTDFNFRMGLRWFILP